MGTKYDVEITLTTDFDPELRASAGSVLGERVYRTGTGSVTVRIDWSPLVREPFTRVSLELHDERENGDGRDLPSFVELFFHDAFLILNLAKPGSFGGVITAVGGEYGVREVALDAWVFEYAEGATRPLADVVAWYDALGRDTSQLAASGVQKALFHLLYLARSEEDDLVSIVRLALASEALGVERDDALFDLRDDLVRGNAPVIHPMYDDALDERLEDPELDYSEVIDRALTAVVAALQAQIPLS